MSFEFGKGKVYARPLDPREGNEWELIGEATGMSIERPNRHVGNAASDDPQAPGAPARGSVRDMAARPSLPVASDDANG